jgi:hypothetical protein
MNLVEYARQFSNLSPRQKLRVFVPIFVSVGTIFLAALQQSIPAPDRDALAVFHSPSEEVAGLKFVNTAEDFGIQHSPHEYPMATFIQRMEFSASVAISDINRDGWPDLVFSNGASDNFLLVYLNRKGRGFSRLESPAFYLPPGSPPNSSTSSVLVADFDLNGTQDILAVRKAGCLWLLLNDGNVQFSLKPLFISNRTPTENLSPTRLCGKFLSANLVDLNLDGRVDVLLHARSHRSPLIMPDLPSNRVLMNYTDGWRDETSKWLGINSDFTWGSLLFYNKPHNRMSKDLRPETYGPDLYLINDFQKPRFYRWRPNRFVERTGRVIPNLSKHGQMGGDTADPGFKNEVWLYATNVARPRSPRGYNYMFRHNPSSPMMREIGYELGVDRCGFGWGTRFIDADNDGLKELIATTGILKGRDQGKNRIENWYYYLQVLSIPDFLYDRSLIDFSESVSGQQRNCFFRQLPDGRFVDVALAAGITDLENGRGVAIGDLDRDGLLDFVVANAEAQPSVYMNRSRRVGNWISFELKRALHQTTVGAVIQLKTSRGTTRYEHFPANGFAGQNDERIYFGLGSDTHASVRVTLPSTLQDLVFADLLANRNHMLHIPSLDVDEAK